MLFSYPFLIHEEDGLWGEFPNLDGCYAQGETLNEIIADATGALDLHLLSMIMDGEKLPEPSHIKEIELDENSFVAIISINLDVKKKDSSVKKTLSIPKWLNEKAEAEGINFSKTLQEALLEKIVLK